MPAGTHRSFVSPPDLNAKIWRYIDAAKLLQFARSRELYMSRLTDLADRFEGCYPDHQRRLIDQEYSNSERTCGRLPSDPPGYAKATEEYIRTCVLVNCWCLHDHESEAMWRIYAPGNGVAIRTTFNRLSAALPSDYFIGCVRYADYDSASFGAENLYDLATHKRKQFAYENEVRVATVAGVPRWATGKKPISPSFLTLPLSFETFEAIVVSPYSMRGFGDSVKDLLRKYDCPTPVELSRMTPDRW